VVSVPELKSDTRSLSHFTPHYAGRPGEGAGTGTGGGERDNRRHSTCRIITGRVMVQALIYSQGGNYQE